MRDFGGYWASRCPVHHGDNDRAFVLFKTNLSWQCHTHSCHGNRLCDDIFALVCAIKKISFVEAVDFVRMVYGVGEVDETVLGRIEFEDAVSRMSCDRNECAKINHLPAELIDLYRSYESHYYMGRGYAKETLDYFQVGYCPADISPDENLLPHVFHKNDQDEYYDLPYFGGRCVIPIHCPDGNLVGFSGRSVENKEPKFIHTPGMPKTKVLYNWHRAKKFESKELIVCESPGAAWSWYEAGFPSVIATLGSSLSKEQVKLITQSPKINRVIIAYDYDVAGKKGSMKAVKSLLGKINVYAIDLPEGADYDHMSAKEVVKFYNKREAKLA